MTMTILPVNTVFWPRSAHRDGGIANPPSCPARSPLLGAIYLITAPHHGLLKGERVHGGHPVTTGRAEVPASSRVMIQRLAEITRVTPLGLGV